MRIGRELKAARKELRLKDAEICATAGVSISTLNNVYDDKPTVRPESVSKVVKAIETLRKQRLPAYQRALAVG